MTMASTHVLRDDITTAGADQCAICGSRNPVGFIHIKDREYVRCDTCGLVYLHGIQTGEEKAAYASDSYQRVQSPHRLGFRETVFQKSLQQIERMKRTGRLLDVGCGDGSFLSLARQRGWDTYGVELSPAACDHARVAFDLDVKCGELKEVGFPDSYFDVVTLNNVLDHLPSPIEELLEIHRILNVRGLLVVRVPNGLFHLTLVRMIKALEPYLVFHLNCFTPKTIRYLLHRAGYEEIVVGNSVLTPSDPYAIASVLGARGMQGIKTLVYVTAQTLFFLSAQSLVVGPSLQVRAVKP